MAQNPLEYLQFLSDEIEQKESDLQPDLCACLLLRTLRIHLCLDLMDAADPQYRSHFLRDWTDATEAVRKLSDAPDISGQIMSDTLELVLLPDPDKRKLLLKQLDLKIRLKIRTIHPLSPSVKCIALGMAEYCQETDRQNVLCTIIQSLILLGEDRNRSCPEVQRGIVIDALRYIVDQDRPLTAQLCENQKQYFENVVDEDACNFYWFYGMSVLSLGDSVSAMPLFKRCYDLCMMVEGETSWIGVRAGSTYYYALLQTDQSAAAEDYLWDILKKIDTGFYPDMDDNADFVAAYTRSCLLSTYFDRGQLRNYLDDILSLLFYCVSVKDTNRSPYLTIRWAENLLSAYHLEVGEPLLAATHAQMALNAAAPDGVTLIPSDILLYSNLLLIYNQLHDEEQIDFYTQKLLVLSEEWENDPYLCDRIDGILFRQQSDIESDEEDLEYNRQVLAEAFDNIRAGGIEPKNTVTKNTEYAWFVINLCLAIIDSPTASREDLIRIRFVMDYFWNHPERYRFSEPQKLTYYLLQTRIEDRLQGSAVLAYMNQAWLYRDAVAQGADARIAFLRYAAAIYYDYGKKGRSLEATDLLLSGITSAWQKATTYFNDRRVCQVLSTAQEEFNLCYALMRVMRSSEELYEQILRFKDLPALVGRERNTRLHSVSVDEDLLSGIRSLQDRLADAELNDSLHGTETARTLREDLEMAEAGLSAQFHKEVRFTRITFKEVCRKLPEDSAVVEYYFVQDESSLFRDSPESGIMALDIFITAKINGQTQFHHLTFPDGTDLMEEAWEFSDILQNPDDLASSGKKVTLRASLHRKLIAPVLPFLEGVSNLYIAPDSALCNIPFEILYGEDRILLQDRYRICRLVCGRDLLFLDDQHSSGGGSFVLGGPDYEAQRGQRCHSRSRSSRGSLEPVDALPFSAVEARRIGKHCRSSIYTGDSATKYALRDALPCRIIHLATHGVYDDNLEKDSLYASHLVFAGYNQWVRNHIESSHCGNGILTADEISRMDLHKTELVVLSACRSGLGDTSYGSVRGLLSAFSAAGARWVISHMWEASDFTTPILMDAFYNAFLKRGMDVPEALQYAKNYLKKITIGQLWQDGWLELPRDIPFPEDIREAIEEMRHWPDQEMPFQDEYYWGGFTVHKSR